LDLDALYPRLADIPIVGAGVGVPWRTRPLSVNLGTSRGECLPVGHHLASLRAAGRCCTVKVCDRGHIPLVIGVIAATVHAPYPEINQSAVTADVRLISQEEPPVSSIAPVAPAAHPIPARAITPHNAPPRAAFVPEPRRRGVFLTLWLGLLTLTGTAAVVVALGTAGAMLGRGLVPGGTLLVAAALVVANLTGLVALWAWRLWGLFVVINAAAGAALLGLLLGVAPPFALLGVAGALVLGAAVVDRALDFA
jgi:hypothetical protein